MSPELNNHSSEDKSVETTISPDSDVKAQTEQVDHLANKGKVELASDEYRDEALEALKAHTSEMSTILTEGFSNITVRFDQVLSYTQQLPSLSGHLVNFLDAQQKQLQLLIERTTILDDQNKTDVVEMDLPSPITVVNDDFTDQLKSIASTALNISESLDGILDRFTRKDYRQANFSCPNRNRGDYQFVGPKGFYSTCYFLAKNV